MPDMEVEEAVLNGERVWIVSARVPFTIASWTELTSVVPRGAQCIHSENDGQYAWSVWTAPLGSYADMASLRPGSCWCCDAERGNSDWKALIQARQQDVSRQG